MKMINHEEGYLNQIRMLLTSTLPHQHSDVQNCDLLLNDGFRLLALAEEKLNFEIEMKESKRISREDFDMKRISVSADYSIHRKVAKNVFREDLIFFGKLHLNERLPKSYHRRLSCWLSFYERINESRRALRAMEMIGLKQSSFQHCLNAITEMHRSYTDYKQEERRSFSASRKKHEAFSSLSKWLVQNGFVLEVEKQKSYE